MEFSALSLCHRAAAEALSPTSSKLEHRRSVTESDVLGPQAVLDRATGFKEAMIGRPGGQWADSKAR